MNVIINGDFETGTLFPWLATNVSLDSSFSHSGFYSAKLFGEGKSSSISQFVPIKSGDKLAVFLSASRLGSFPNPILSTSVSYYDLGLNFLGYGLIVNNYYNRLPDVTTVNAWVELYNVTTPAPVGTTQALFTIVSLSQAETSGVLVDDIEAFRISESVVPPGIRSQKYFTLVSFGTYSGSNLILPAEAFVDDNGNTVSTLPSNYEYFNLYINGMLQENGIVNISASEIIISGGANLDGSDPIALEFVVRS